MFFDRFHAVSWKEGWDDKSSLLFLGNAQGGPPSDPPRHKSAHRLLWHLRCRPCESLKCPEQNDSTASSPRFIHLGSCCSTAYFLSLISSPEQVHSTYLNLFNYQPSWLCKENQDWLFTRAKLQPSESCPFPFVGSSSSSHLLDEDLPWVSCSSVITIYLPIVCYYYYSP